MNHLVIMAGGAGNRLWPMSTVSKPKQFIDVLGVGQSLLQLTVNRFAGICSPENIWVVTSVKYKEFVREQLPDIPEDHILLEPEKRNTAPCIAYVSWKIKKRDPSANLIVTPSDHLVLDIPEFCRVIRKGLSFVDREDKILTLGMYPTRPETGYGYIKIAGKEEEEIRKVDAFQEKPDLPTAMRYLDEGGYYWNAGIILWNVATIEKALRDNKPGLAAAFDCLDDVYYTADEQPAIDRMFPACENISIDYAVLEHAPNIFVFPASFGWSDLGTWSSLYEHLEKDESLNAVIGSQVRMIDCHGCMVHVPEDKEMVIQGLDNYIIAEENGAMLICKKAGE